MYIRLVNDRLNVLAPQEIKVEFDANFLRISPKLKEMYLANERSQPLPEAEYFMDYETTFSDLLSRTECVGDDSWIFPLPPVGFTNFNSPPPIEYHEGMYGPIGGLQFDFGKLVAARLAIRPTSKNFNEGAILSVIGAPGCILTVVGNQEIGMILPSQQINMTTQKIKWNTLVRDLVLKVKYNLGDPIEYTTLNGEINGVFPSGRYEISSRFNVLKVVDV